MNETQIRKQLGLVCHFVDSDEKNVLSNKTVQLGSYRSGKHNEESIYGVYQHNVDSLCDKLPSLLGKLGVGCFRMPSDVFPLWDVVPRSLWDNEHFRGKLGSLGNKLTSMGVRLVTHPGQYCVLSSDDERVVTNTVRELENHSTMMDFLEQPVDQRSAINIHIGKKGGESNFIKNFLRLSDNLKRRLTIENCETSGTVSQLLPISACTGVPILFDSHHHSLNPGDMSIDEAICASLKTWTDNIVPVQHVSNSNPEFADSNLQKRRAHSKWIHSVPKEQQDLVKSSHIVLEMEFKGKNLAIDRSFVDGIWQ